MNTVSSVTRLLLALSLACLSGIASSTLKAAESGVPTAHRIVVLGDSITYSGQYVDYLETFLRTRFPARSWEIINVGLPSETVSGLSEPGHAGGKFPRPDLHERLDRMLAKTKPELVIACYGMNDGIYYPSSPERLLAYQNGIRRLRDKVLATGAQIIHLTPPVFDPVPLKGKTLPAGLDAYPQPFEGYNTVLDQFSQWLLDQRKQGWAVIDVHGPMTAHLAARRLDKPEFQFAPDGVHDNATGHWLITEAILDAWQVPPVAGIATIDFPSGKVTSGVVTDFVKESGALSFKWKTGLPMAIDPQWDATSLRLDHSAERFNQFRLRVVAAPAPRYDLFEDGTLLGVVTAHELTAGIDLLRYPKLTANTKAMAVLKLIRERQHVLKDAWLNDIGHKRPGMAKGWPVAEAEAKAAELEKAIKAAAQPVLIQLRLAPSQAPFPGQKSEWNGFDRYDFEVDGHLGTVVVPKQAAPGKPWAWQGEFFGHKPAPDIALLEKGFHIVYLSVPDMLGCPEAVAHWNVFYHELTTTYGLGPKPALEGLSRGGLYCYNWAIANPNKVSCIYADAPVCDFKSWPGGKGKGKGSPRDWQLVMSRYGFKSEAEALAYPGNPIDNLAPLARAKVPLLHVYGDADDVVPWPENTGIIAERYRKLGGDITLIAKPGVGHHPHGLDDSTPIIDFILKHAAH